MAAGYQNLRPLSSATNAQYVDFGSLPFAIPFRGHLFFVRKDGLSPAQV